MQNVPPTSRHTQVPLTSLTQIMAMLIAVAWRVFADQWLRLLR